MAIGALPVLAVAGSGGHSWEVDKLTAINNATGNEIVAGTAII